jgi:uncharacterized protein (DUF1778 family)
MQPKFPASEPRITLFPQIRVSVTEREQVELAAGLAGLTLSEFIRSEVCKAAAQQVKEAV